MPRYYLTDKLVQQLKCPENKTQTFIWDHPCTLDGKIKTGSQEGLGVRITSNGARAYIHDYKLNGKRKRVVIGKVSRMSVASARLAVQQRESDVDEGMNPDADKINYRQKHTITLKEVIDQYFAGRMHSRGKSHRDEFGRLIAPWTRPAPLNPHRGNKRTKHPAFGTMFGDEPAQNITPQHLAKFLNNIENAHRYNGALRQVKTLYNWAINMQLVDMRNPATPFEFKKTLKQRRDYTPQDIKMIAQCIFQPVLEVLPDPSECQHSEKRLTALSVGRVRLSNQNMTELCHFLGILFLTMARPNELKTAKFEHFDLDQLIWHKHNTKGIKLSNALYEHAFRSVPIHPKVAELVAMQKQRWPDSDYVFPNHDDMTKPRDNFSKALKRFRELDCIPDHFQMYDVKRIAISLMITGQGVRREDVSHYVDHRGNIDTTLIYDMGFVEPMRPVTQKLGELLGV